MYFFLPQSRPRVYGSFLKRADFSEESADARRQDIRRARGLILRMQVSQPEPLEVLLDRCPKDPPNPASRRSKQGLPSDRPKKGQKWPLRHKQFADQHHLSEEDLLLGAGEYKLAMRGSVLPQRAQDALWLKLVHLRKSKNVDFRESVLVAAVGASVSFMQVRQQAFPTVQPKMQYAILRKGSLEHVHGLHILAAQGIQPKEVEALGVHEEASSFLQDLGGNAITANILAAYLLAGLIVM